MSEYKRSMSLERGVINLDTGEFPVTLFTNGEASDGHIIDVGGLRVGDQIPMYVNHVADPRERAGSLFAPSKVVPSESGPNSVRALGDSHIKMVGRVDVSGDSAAADIRRDLAHGISVGDITAMSGRWDGVKSVSRHTLPETHYAYSSRTDNPNGIFFEQAVALEGSIVGLGADKAALIGRSEDDTKPVHVREFYRSLVGRIGNEEESTDDIDGQLAAYAAQGRSIGVLEVIETDMGEFLVPPSVAEIVRSLSIHKSDNCDGEPSDITSDSEVIATEERQANNVDWRRALNDETRSLIATVRSKELVRTQIEKEVSAMLAEHLGSFNNG